MGNNNRTKRTTICLIILFMTLFSIVSGRLIYVQVTGEVQNNSLKALAEEIRSTSALLLSERGSIFDVNGNVLALNRPVYRLYAIVDETYTQNIDDPQHVVDARDTASKLAPLLNMEVTEVENIIEEGKKDVETFQVEFKLNGRNLSQETKEEIESLDLSGINFIRETTRYYPNNLFASHVIGFANDKESNELIGITGIEQFKNDILTGEDGYVNFERDKYNQKLVKSEDVLKEAINGHDIYLTIDQKIQSLLEDILTQAEEEYDPERIVAVVMNPKNGEILAMGNRPTFNLNNPENIENWYNDAISTPVEPGSTAKMFTWAAAIDSGVYNGDETFKSGSYKIHEKVEPVNDHNRGRGWGNISYNEGFRRSSNVAASKLVWEKLDEDVYLDYLHKFGFEQNTGIDLPKEQHGQISFTYPSDKLRTSFGQGSTLTPLQQMKAATAFVNEGEMLQPYVIKKIVDSNNGEIVESNERKVTGKPIKKETANQMLNLLDSVVNTEEGTGKRYRLEDYSVIGKTGTAQIPDAENGGYLDGEHDSIFSFLGMAPKDSPELMMFVSVKQPKLDANEPGSSTVSFIFNNVMEKSLQYLNIEPDKDTVLENATLNQFPKIVGENIEHVKKQLTDFNHVSIVGEGDKVIKTNIEVNESVYKNKRIIVVTDKITMPNLIGWSHRDIRTLSQLLKIPFETNGSGYVTEQNLEEGTLLKSDSKIKLTLSDES